MPVQIAPSLLAANFLSLGTEIEMLNKTADIIHLDVMDGSFVPNISFGFPVIDQLSKVARIPMDAHLMVVNPDKWFDKLHEEGVQMVSFHLEVSGDNTGTYIDSLHRLGIKAGIAINPDIPVRSLFEYIGKADYFLVMSVFAGFGGQDLVEDTYSRIKELKEAIDRYGADTPIEVDGGVRDTNIQALKKAGASIIVTGSHVFRSQDPSATIEKLRNL
ncbi:MAG: ribulose-phosphate 3-epimerase [Bacteroidales bacterium]|nr:ribulose-phosphate 3-epimerase [Bacteroidales bacterium]